MRRGHEPRRIHIGHHFFGSGNIGDDLMLAGFLDLAGTWLAGATFTCSTPFDRASQHRRFPAIEWLPYEPAVRAAAIEACDAWVGVGDTPFQTDVGTWFLDHLAEESELCRRFGKPMFFLGVGVNNREALDHPHARAVISQADHIWTRDAQATAWLRDAGDPARISQGADLAHVHLAQRTPPPREPGTLAFLLNFENRDAFSVEAIVGIVESSAAWRHRWLVQEVRPLDGSEREILALLPAAVRDRLEIRCPDYAHDSLDALLDVWGTPEVLVTSRYHGALAGAWAGSRILIVERNDKLSGLAAQLGCPSVGDLRANPDVLGTRYPAAAIDRDILMGLAGAARQSGEALAAALARAGSPIG
jgi:polysaccharide pyruvyl transferase WcaK-like protein